MTAGPSGMRALLLEPGDPAWDVALSRVHHDLCYLPAFVELETRWHEAGSAATFQAEEHGRTTLAPLIRKTQG